MDRVTIRSQVYAPAPHAVFEELTAGAGALAVTRPR